MKTKKNYFCHHLCFYGYLSQKHYRSRI